MARNILIDEDGTAKVRFFMSIANVELYCYIRWGNSLTSTAAIYSVIRLREWNIIQTPQLTFKGFENYGLFAFCNLTASNWLAQTMPFKKLRSRVWVTFQEFLHVHGCHQCFVVFLSLLGVRVWTRTGTIFKLWAENYFWQVGSSRVNHGGGTAYFTMNCTSSTI